MFASYLHRRDKWREAQLSLDVIASASIFHYITYDNRTFQNKEDQRGISHSSQIEGKNEVQKGWINFSGWSIHRSIRERNYANRISVVSPIYLAAVIEYLVTEVLELAGNTARTDNRNRITPRDLQLAIRSDNELAALLRDVMIAEGGVLPTIHSVLISEAPTDQASNSAQDDVNMK